MTRESLRGVASDPLSAGDLLTDDGTINVSRVTSRSQVEVSRDACATLRAFMANAENATIARAQRHDALPRDMAASAVRNHISGSCMHKSDTPPVEHVDGEWQHVRDVDTDADGDSDANGDADVDTSEVDK